MYLEKINLINFKNYESLNTEFSEGVNCLVGLNGCGKTNLLDAVFYLSFTKSAFNLSDHQNIMHGEPFFSVTGVFKTGTRRNEVQITLQQQHSKQILVDQKKKKKASGHVGDFPVVLVAPGDMDLILEGSEIRRKMIDMLLSQLDQLYLEDLMTYSRALKHRNQLLKYFYKNQLHDQDQLDPFDQIILRTGKRIAETRSRFVARYEPLLQEHFRWISNGKEQVTLRYSSSFLEDDFEDTFYRALEKDMILQRTTQGIHRDDIIFEMNNYPLKKYGSQGQQKSYIIALKLSQFDILFEQKGFKPILLLDDIFDKLDDERIGKIVDLIENHKFGQIFLTDARPERTWHFLGDIKTDLKVFQVEKGVFEELMQ